MSTGTLVGLSLVVVGAAVWSLGATGLARANPGQRIDRDGNEGLGRYRTTYFIGFACAMVGGFQLRDEHGWWAPFVALAVFMIPATVITTTHDRGLPRRTSGRPGR